MSGCVSIPTMPTSNNITWLEQGWTEQERQKFHHTSQGTMTLPIPYEWFAALEQPGFKLFGTKGLIIENGYLARLGFITGEVTPYNQAGLPVGFSVDYNVTNPAISKTTFNAIGLTCAACHTGQMRINDTSVRYDGGPAMTNLTEFISVLAVALIETYVDEAKFSRFSQRILGVTNTKNNRKNLRKSLKHTLKNQLQSIVKPAELQLAGLRDKARKDIKEHPFRNRIKIIRDIIKDRKKSTAEGFTRLDALNRIGNAVFGTDTGNVKNIVKTDAPVNYPHLWNTSWFLWVQYDASIMGPMIRNAGEALGVAAYVTLDQNSPNNFDSSVKLDNLFWMESLLGGTTPPTKNKKFYGLQPPQWREDIFGKINREKHAQGAKLYAKLCQGCHLPPMDSEKFWSDTYWTKPDKRNLSYLDLPIIDINYIGTDPQEALVLIKRKVDTTNIGLNTRVYLEDKEWFTKNNPVYFGSKSTDCKPVTVTDEKSQFFSLALGATVQSVNNYWYKTHNTPILQQEKMNGYRKNCLRAPFAYKARPLNGIWATAPFLHNGSVPNIYTLLSPVKERPKKFYLGSLDYDTKKMGYKMIKAKGFFELDTTIIGNSNKGHEFSNTPGRGVIGRGLSKKERYQLIEYLKDIRVVDNNG
ncbi:MAG: di-heme-cytochrome C peroxidase [Gammaproteobacteria bacterium]|nr:di-heme-cytochrome C peroxidase [Gammaproteobacteria bacterium]